ncbi:MAG: transglutaminase-like domain-containing protein [Pseudomonadota bacterium]
MTLKGYTMKVTYSAQVPEGTSEILIPGGLATPHGHCIDLQAQGVVKVKEATTGQVAYRMTPQSGEVTIHFVFDRSACAYPDAMFKPHPSRFTRFADDLLAEVAPVASHLTGSDRARAIACHVAERFTYGHPDAKFNDGFDVVPALGCGLTEGSCVDINTYFLAALRAAGIDAGYVTGFFFPEEKAGTCEDGHCWVVTRIDGQTEEWDIAHHLKLGTRDIRPNLNPKPGVRFACFHSMGLDFPDLGIVGVKALIEPMAVVDGQLISFEAPRIKASALAPA